MSFHPILAPVVLALGAATLFAARAAALHRLWPSRTRMALWRWTSVSAAAVLLLVAATRPVLGEAAQIAPAGASDGQPNVFLVVDRSPGMDVADGGAGRSRMDAVRDDLVAVIEHYPDARISLIGFSSRPALEWPLSQDTWSLLATVPAVAPYRTSAEDAVQNNVAAAGNVLRYQLIGARQQFPGAKNLVFYFGAGASESESPQREFALAEGSVDGGAVLGYGTAAGGPVPQYPSIRSALDEPALRAVAAQLGVPYLPRSGQASDTMFADATAPEQVDRAVRPSTSTETYWAPAIAASALLLLELYFTLVDFRRTRSRPVDVTT